MGRRSRREGGGDEGGRPPGGRRTRREWDAERSREGDRRDRRTAVAASPPGRSPIPSRSEVRHVHPSLPRAARGPQSPENPR